MEDLTALQAARLAPEDVARAGFYGVLARFLLQPTPELVALLAQQPVPDACTDQPDQPDDLPAAWCRLVEASREQGFEAIAASHESLFVALGTPAVNPFGSYYQTGALMDLPLAELRHSLARLGLRRVDGTRELEDHLGALCDAMRELIVLDAPPAEQATFFQAHLHGWSRRCLDDIAAAPGAGFYAALAAFAVQFFAAEALAFGLEEDAAPVEPDTELDPA
jgi:TorA maturation chaperone TorD